MASSSVIIYSVYAIVAAVFSATISAQESESCQACNCQLNNVEALNELIQTNIRSGKSEL